MRQILPCFLVSLIFSCAPFALSSETPPPTQGLSEVQLVSPTDTPSPGPFPIPTVLWNVPTYPQTAQPTFIARPSAVPTGIPTSVPTAMPSKDPTIYNPNMTIFPTDTPSTAPTSMPSPAPTHLPTISVEPTRRPTDSKEPSFVPTSVPTAVPTFTFFPTKVPVKTESPTEYWSLPPTTSVPSSAPTNASLLCQGFSCNGPGGALKCPDNTAQSRKGTGSAGGNVFVTVVAAQGLDDRDGTTVPDAGIARLSDPYVRVRVGTEGHWSTEKTARVGNRENVRWGEKLALGWHRAGEARMRFEVLDYDTGLEVVDGGDDTLGTTSLWLPFCSTLTAEYDDLDCEEEVCAAQDSSWAMPRRQLCREEGWLLLDEGKYTTVAAQACCETDAACIRVIIEIVPFQVYVDDIYTLNPDPAHSFGTALFVNPAIESAGQLPTEGFGRPYVDKGTMYTLDDGAMSPLDARGAILLRTTASDGRVHRFLPEDDEVDTPFRHARLSVNAQATLILCRLASCYPVPEWIQEQGWDYVVPISVLKDDRYQGYACYQRIVGPTKRNRYGTIEADAIDLGWPRCDKNYFVIAKPHMGTPAKVHPWQLHFERIKFFIKLVQFGIPLLVLVPGALQFLSFCEFRLDRFDARLLSIGGGAFVEQCRGTSTLPATLFMGDGATTNNREFRHNHYWASRCTRLFLLVPCVVFWTFGITIITSVQPANVGLGIFFIGSAATSLLFALTLWHRDRWRLTHISGSALVVSSGCVLVFSIIAVLLDPKLMTNKNGTSALDFLALTLAMLILGLVPLALEVIEFSKTVYAAKCSLAVALAAAATDVQKQFPGNHYEDYWLMKECYSASSDSPHFDFVTDVAGDLCGLSNRINSTQTAAARRALLHAVARFALIIYVVIAFLLTSKGYLALVIAFFLNTIDIIHNCLDRGFVRWSPTKAVSLMAAARALIVLGGSNLWVIGFSAAYASYGFVLVHEVVNKYLPYLNHLEACGIVFLARGVEGDVFVSQHSDVAGTPEFALTALTVSLLAVVLVAGFAIPPGLPLPDVFLTSHARIPVYMFAITALIFVVFCGLVCGSARATYLGSQNLLLGKAATVYLFSQSFTLPKILAGLAYLCPIIAGLLLWGASNSPSALAVCALGPLCILFFLRAGSSWLVNDCRLVIWPPRNLASMEGDNVSESELAFGMLQAMMGDATQPKDTKTLGKLELPQLVRTCEDDAVAMAGIEMPMLPPRSTMKKRVAAVEDPDTSKKGVQNAAPVVHSVAKARIRHQKIDLGLHNLRVKKLKWLLASPPKEGDDERARKRKRRGLLPNLTLKEVCFHLFNLLWQCCISYVVKPKAKVADEATTPQNKETLIPIAPDDPLVDLAWLHMPLWEAALTGCLLPDEYTSLFCAGAAPVLYVVLGGLLTLFSRPQFAGHLLWIVGTSVCCTSYPIVKWFKICKLTWDMVCAGVLGWALYVGVLGWAFYAWLDTRVDVVETLWTIDALVLYPLSLNGLYRFLNWIDHGCKDPDPTSQQVATSRSVVEGAQGNMTNIELDASVSPPTQAGEHTSKKWALYVPRMACQCPPGLVLFTKVSIHLALLAQVYLWGSRYAALLCLLIFLGLWATSYFVRSWANNDFYLPPQLIRTSDLAIMYGSFATTAIFCVLTFAPAATTFSILFLLQLFKHITKIVNHTISLDPDAIFWFARTILPAYSYSTRQNLLLDQTQLVIRSGAFVGTGICWGVALVCFVQPVSMGIVLMSIFISTAVVLAAVTCSHVPEKLGTAATYLSKRIFVDAATEARNDFVHAYKAEISKFEAQCDEWDQNGNFGHGDVEWEEQVDLDENSNTEIENPEIITNATSRGPVHECAKLGPSALAIATEINAAELAFRLVTPADGTPVWRADALYTDLDGLAESCASRGPFGCVGFFACICKLGPMHQSLQQFDEEGRRVLAQETVEFEAIQAVLHLPELDMCFRRRFEYELRSLVRFQLLVLTATEAHLTYEQVLFQKFVRENRFKLLSNGVAPPREIFETLSSSAVNMRLVASWLISLNEDQRERFYLLQENCKVEQTDHEANVDQHDRSEVETATKFAFKRLERERTMFDKRVNDCTVRRFKRTQTWVASLTLEERDRFLSVLQKQWETKSDCLVQPGDESMRASYELHVLLSNDETVGNCRERLAELEAGELDCYPSKSRKGALQFIDPEFQPGPEALGTCAGAEFVGAWNHALSINPHAVLFADGSDPDDVHPGVCVKDGWLLAALSMLSAAGGVGNGDVDHQIKRLFINMVDLEGNIVYDSAVGAFGVQLYVNGQWEAIVVDDALPMLGDGTSKSGVSALAALDACQDAKASIAVTFNHDSKETPKLNMSTLDKCSLPGYRQRYKHCAGFAISHSAEMAELWVSLLEKGVAKYYGSYAAVETGFVHHGLELLTGNRSECLHIAEASRGVGKWGLWGKLLRYHKNEYILGAGAVSAEHASPLLYDSGLLLGATYTIYDIRDVIPERHKLIKLRNPAGHTGTFEGEWSRHSHLWTKRLRRAFLRTLEPQTFWISFDEFCYAFRCLFICHYYTTESTRWKRQALSGEWNCGLTFSPEGVSNVETVPIQRENTAAGLPSSHNPGCEVERNPQYALSVHRPITLRLSVTQTDAMGRANANVLPIAAFLCRAENCGENTVDRVTGLGNHNIITSTGSARRERAIDAYVDNLDPGVYVLLLGTYQAEMEGHFTITAISNYDIGLTQIWPPPWRATLDPYLIS